MWFLTFAIGLITGLATMYKILTPDYERETKNGQTL